MHAQRLARLVTAGAILLLPTLASAQALGAASVTGVVRDPSGGVLPGVTVEATSPVLIEGARISVTDAEGRYRLVDLRPGTYIVTFTLPGFRTLRREGLQLTADFNATVNVDLAVGGIEETITVTGDAPLVDVRNVQQQTTINRADPRCAADHAANGQPGRDDSGREHARRPVPGRRRDVERPRPAGGARTTIRRRHLEHRRHRLACVLGRQLHDQHAHVPGGQRRDASRQRGRHDGRRADQHRAQRGRQHVLGQLQRRAHPVVVAEQPMFLQTWSPAGSRNGQRDPQSRSTRTSAAASAGRSSRTSCGSSMPASGSTRPSIRRATTTT